MPKSTKDTRLTTEKLSFKKHLLETLDKNDRRSPRNKKRIKEWENYWQIVYKKSLEILSINFERDVDRQEGGPSEVDEQNYLGYKNQYFYEIMGDTADLYERQYENLQPEERVAYLAIIQSPLGGEKSSNCQLINLETGSIFRGSEIFKIASGKTFSIYMPAMYPAIEFANTNIDNICDIQDFLKKAYLYSYKHEAINIITPRFFRLNETTLIDWSPLEGVCMKFENGEHSTFVTPREFTADTDARARIDQTCLNKFEIVDIYSLEFKNISSGSLRQIKRNIKDMLDKIINKKKIPKLNTSRSSKDLPLRIDECLGLSEKQSEIIAKHFFKCKNLKCKKPYRIKTDAQKEYCSSACKTANHRTSKEKSYSPKRNHYSLKKN